MIKNYYKILGVDILSSKEDIKRAYRELAKQYHPDRNPDNPESESMFKEIQEAYSVLSDDDERAHYDIQLKYVIETPKEYIYDCPEPPQDTITIKKKTIKLAAIFVVIAIIASIVLIFEYNYIKHNRRHSLEPGMTIEEVVNIYGEPSEMTDDAIFYQSSKIYLKNGKVLGWYNADDILDIKNSDVEKISDIKIGEDIEDIFNDYGYPDTYAQTFITYYDVIIMYKNGKVTEVSKYNAD